MITVMTNDECILDVTCDEFGNPIDPQPQYQPDYQGGFKPKFYPSESYQPQYGQPQYGQPQYGQYGQPRNGLYEGYEQDYLIDRQGQIFRRVGRPKCRLVDPC